MDLLSALHAGGHMPTQVQTALGLLSSAAKSKLAGVFGSYGWSEAVDEIESKLQNAGYRFFETGQV